MKIKHSHRVFLILLSIIFIVQPALVFALPETPARQQLENELQNIERQIADYERQLAGTRNQSRTLANKISQLKTQQSALRLQIKTTSLKISELDNKLSSTQSSIQKNLAKDKKFKAELAALLKMMNEENKKILLALFTQGGLSEMLTELKNYTRLSLALTELVGQTKAVRRELEKQRIVFDKQQDEAEHLLAIKSSQQQELGGKLREQNVLLDETKGIERVYQNVIKDNKKKAAEIKNRIYELMGVGRQISFGEALEIAQWVSGETGVRPAFLLAVLTQESNLGKNVGTCNRPGDPPEKSWRVVMKPERDQEPFLKITEELGLNPNTTPVSCPMKRNGQQIGWGGAMGPAQFIPSTWMGYKDKVATLTGRRPANPWDIRDAFAAAGIKLKAGGANGTEQGEWNAAMRYFSGSTNPRFKFYGDNVLAIARRYQEDINQLN